MQEAMGQKDQKDACQKTHKQKRKQRQPFVATAVGFANYTDSIV